MNQFSHQRSTLVATLVERMKAAIAGGAYPPGSTLPSTRALAEELGVSRTSLTFVYEHLSAQGYIRTRPGARASVAYTPQQHVEPDHRAGTATQSKPRLSRTAMHLLHGSPAATSQVPPRFDFRYGDLADEDFPTLAWRRLLVSALLQRQQRLAYEDPAGNPELRKALWGYLRRSRGITCDVEQIHVVQGSQQALDLCARLLLNPGESVAMENPGYRMAALAFEAAGAQVIDLPVDDHGAVTDDANALRRAQVALLTPSHQFPLGGILPIGRRLQLLEWAERHNAYIIEDDYDGEYRYDSPPVEALFSLDRARRVLYVGTLSKTLSPQLRLGYLVVPPELAPALARLRSVTDRGTPRLEQLALARFIANGDYEQHVRRMRRRNAKRRQALIEALRGAFGDRVRVQGTQAGLHLVMWFAGVPHSREAALVSLAAQVNIGLYPIAPLFRGTRPAHYRDAGFVVGYGSLSIEHIHDGVRCLATALAGHLQGRPRT